MPGLFLKFLDRECIAFFEDHVNGDKKIGNRKLAAFENGAALECRAETALLALELLLRCQPVMMHAAAFLAGDPVPQPEILKCLRGYLFVLVNSYQITRLHGYGIGLDSKASKNH